MKTKTLLFTALVPTLTLSCVLLLRADDPPAPTGPDGAPTTAALVDELKKSAAAAADPALKPLGDDLGAKVSALSTSLGTNSPAQGRLQTALKSLLGDKGPDSLDAFQKLTQAKLTPDQGRMAKDVYHTGSAYLVQKNFGSLEGSQSEVAQVVSSLRKGSAVEALPGLKKIGENAKLTQPQKDLLASLSDKYAHGLKKASDSLKGLPGLGK